MIITDSGVGNAQWQPCVERRPLALWLLLILIFVVGNLDRFKMKIRFSLVLGLVSGVLVIVYLNEKVCSMPSPLNILPPKYEDDERIRHVLRMVDQLGVDELDKMTQEFLGGTFHKRRKVTPVSYGEVVEEDEEEPFSMVKLGHFDPEEFVAEHKAKCEREAAAAEERFKRTALPGISARQAAIQYKGRLPKWEMEELTSGKFEKVYFAGVGSNKTQMLQQNVTNNFGFDNPIETKYKGQYRWKIGDNLAYRFEIVKYLGGGTYGEVVKAIDHKFKQEVAVKILNNYTSIAKHTMKEYNVLTKINRVFPSSNFFIRNLENFRFRNHFCMVFELLGDSAYDLYEKSNFRHDAKSLRSYISDILKSMVLLHSIDIIHNDMKPDNLLAPIHRNRDEPRIKIMDFGLSCIRGSSNIKCPDYYIQTRYYRSPEVMLAIEYTDASDMWSLGIIVGEMFRGSEFIFGETEADQFAAIMENVGLPPVELIEQSTRRKVYYEGVSYVTKKGFARRPYRKSISKTLLLESPKDDIFLDFMTRLLQWDPKKRMSAAEALNHPWITGIKADFTKLPAI